MPEAFAHARNSMTPSILPGPLAGVRIIDLTWLLVGAGATRLLTTLGAEGIRIEAPAAQRQDAIRLRPPYMFARLVSLGDVVTENFSARQMERWGFDYEQLRRLKADILYVQMSGLGYCGRNHLPLSALLPLSSIAPAAARGNFSTSPFTIAVPWPPNGPHRITCIANRCSSGRRTAMPFITSCCPLRFAAVTDSTSGLAAPWIAPESSWQFVRPDPHLGQHNVAIYGALGLSDADLEALRQRGVI
jgi:crotonobetainyl-CoA:carnitine CoA-transferase CaiB-like acyl-CoA transferase